jgi:hypothetical protein
MAVTPFLRCRSCAIGFLDEAPDLRLGMVRILLLTFGTHKRIQVQIVNY